MKRPRVPVPVLDPQPQDCWLVADDRSRNIVEVRKLPAGTDLMRTYINELLRYHDEGWQVREFGTHGSVFVATKHLEERHVRIVRDEPQGGRSREAGFFRRIGNEPEKKP